MDPALQDYPAALQDSLDKLHRETMERTDDILKQLQDRQAQFSKLDAAVSAPQLARPTVAASDGGLTVDATVAAVLPDVSSSTTKAQEVLEVPHDASLDSIDPMPMTCSTDGSNQVVATAIVNEVRDAATDTFTQLVSPVTTEAYNGVVVIDAKKFAAPAPTMCSTECSSRDVTASMSALAAAATPASSSATVDIVPELTAFAAGVEALDIDANGVAVLTPTRCSTDCIDNNPNEGEEALPMSCFVFACSQGGGCQKHPWPPPQVISLTGVYSTALISTKEPFSCLPGTQLQSWRPPDRATSDAKQSNQAGYSQAVVQETSCLETFHTHVGYLTCLGPEAIHREPVNYKGMQFYPCCIVQSREGAEFCVHLYASYEFYLEKFALVRKLENSGSNNSILSVITPLVHSSNTCSVGNILVPTWRSQGLSVEQLQESTSPYTILVLNWLSSLTYYKPCACFLDDKYVVVIKLLAQLIGNLIGSAHERGVQHNAVESNEFKSNNSLCSGIHLVESLVILIELEQDTDQSSYGIKPGLYLFCATTSSRALMVLLLEWSLSSRREFLAGAIVISISVTCIAKLCSAGGIIFSFSRRMQLWFCMVISNWIEFCPFFQLTSEEGGKCPVMIVVFTSTSENAEIQSIMIHLKRSVHWQFRGKEEPEGSGTCTSDNRIIEGKEVIITMLSTIINCSRTVQHSTMGVVKNELWCFYHPCHNCPAALLRLQKLANLQVEQIWYADAIPCGGADLTRDLFKMELDGVAIIPSLLHLGGLASYLCSIRALTPPMHSLFEVWIACVLSICIQMRMAKPMASGELNQWMAIIFFLGAAA